MLACDRCACVLNPDVIGFEGRFFEEHEGAEIHFCDDCAPQFHLEYIKFKQRYYDDVRIAIKEKKEKKK